MLMQFLDVQCPASLYVFRVIKLLRLFLRRVRPSQLFRSAQLAPMLVAVVAGSAVLQAQDSARVVTPAARTGAAAARLRITFQPPTRGTVRDAARVRVNGPVRALLPAESIDSMVPQTLRESSFVAVCASVPVDSARLSVRVGDLAGSATVTLTAGLNRLALGVTRTLLRDGDLAEWSLAAPDGTLLLQERIQRQVVRATPTVNSLARNGIWYDALDLFVLDALRGIPLATERLGNFLAGVGAASCAGATPSP